MPEEAEHSPLSMRLHPGAEELTRLDVQASLLSHFTPETRRGLFAFFEEADGWDDMTARSRLSPEALAARFRERVLKQSRTVWARLPYGLEVR